MKAERKFAVIYDLDGLSDQPDRTIQARRGCALRSRPALIFLT